MSDPHPRSGEAVGLTDENEPSGHRDDRFRVGPHHPKVTKGLRRDDWFTIGIQEYPIEVTKFLAGRII